MAHPTGWLIVQDLLVVQPFTGDARRPDYRRAPDESAACGTLLRLATCIEGHVDVVINAVPVFEYGQATGHWDYEGDGYGTMTCRPPEGDPTLTLTSSLRLGAAGARCYGRSTVQKGETAFAALSWAEARRPTWRRPQEQVAATVSYWREWLSNGTFPDHPWRSFMERSALTLKGLSYAPTGAIMAAPTTSLPETPGGARNWDYRYTWIRDSSFMLRSLYRLGFDWEALEYFAFVLEAIAGGAGDFELQIMYGIDGRKDLTEQTLDHLTGWRQLTTGAGRQRGVGSTPERRLGDDHRRRRHPPPPGVVPDRQAGVGRGGQAGRYRDRTLGRRRPGDLGDTG